jgi:hypothetical protein
MTLAGGDGALQIVGDREKLAREICNGILAHILHRSLGAAPGVLGIRQRPQHAIAQGCILGGKCLRIRALFRCPCLIPAVRHFHLLQLPPALPGYWFDNCWWPQLVASGGLSQFAVVDGELGQRNDVRALAPAADGALWAGTFGGGLARHLLPLIIDLQSTAPTEAILNLIVHDLLPT